jgi:hypothetical protein
MIQIVCETGRNNTTWGVNVAFVMNVFVFLHIGCTCYCGVMMVVHVDHCVVIIVIVGNAITVITNVIITAITVNVRICNKRFLYIIVYIRYTLHNVINNRFNVLSVNISVIHTIIYNTT